MAETTEQQWLIGQEEYDRTEVEAMLSTQRAMIYNDVKYAMIEMQEKKGIKGKLSEEQIVISETILACRKPTY